MPPGRGFLQDLAGLFFPAVTGCALCGGDVPDGVWPICGGCLDSLLEAAPRSHVLEVLGRPLPVRAVSVYDGRARAAVHLLKYGGRRDLAGPLGELVAALVAAEAPGAEVVVPVPLHAARRRRRGYNQAGLLASVVARRLGSPDVPHALARVHPTGAQAGSGASSRRLNVIGAFAAPRPGLVARRRVLLVDDVITTGATAAACAAALFRAGAAAVDVAAFAAAGVTTKK